MASEDGNEASASGGGASIGFPLQFYSKTDYIGEDGRTEAVHIYDLDPEKVLKFKEDFAKLIVEPGRPTRVVVKKLRDYLYTEDMKKFLEREKALSQELRHEGIVVSLGLTTTIAKGAGKTGSKKLNSTYLVMELCQCNLEHLLKELKSADRTLYEWEIGIIIKQILEAIFYMHKEKVLHRDLKPTNILIKIPGCSQSYNPRLNWKEMDIDTLVVKVADFGHSRHVPNKDVDQTLTGNVGTPRYRAPEVNTDVPEKYGEKADIYSIGLIALKMLGREQYGDGEDTGDAKGDPKVGDSLPASTSDAAKDFVSKILDVKNAMDRPSARRLLAHKFITDPDRKLTVALDSAIQSIACTKSHVVVLFEDGTVCLVDSHTKTADKRLTAIINSEVLLPYHKEVFALASYENSFALATSEDTVKIWTIAEDGTSVKRVEPEMKFRNDQKDDKITWLGLSELHVIALFEEGSMRALSLENPRFKELRIKNSAFENPLHFDLDNKQPSRSYITTVIEGGKKIQQSSIRDKNRDRRVVQSPITRVVDLQTVVSCIAWGDQIDDEEEEKSLPEEEEKSQSEEDDELETNAEHTFVYLSYGRSVVLLDLQDGKVLREVSLPSGQEVSYISFGMGVLFSVVAKGKDRWIIAFEQSDIQEVDPNYYTYTMLSATKEPSPFRVIAKFESAAAAAPNPRAQGVESFDKQWPLVVSDTEVVFAVEGKLHFLDKTGIMVKRKVYKLD